MQQSPARPSWRLTDWIVIPLCHPEYRRLMWWCFTLTVRLELLSLMVTLASPIVTPGLVLMLRDRFETLRAEAAEFRRAVYAPQSRLVLQRETAAPREQPVAMRPQPAPVYENPWA